ncbi:MAG: tRNA lysidine(34) synthetase TilS [Arenimonas sp. SCN 70-307]|uniref:tRNA lysidine(34) synthetase TilS n=1 Tax=Arenimonas sp. SCN 70-307 TaxID=1660089 RepID=UPI00086E217F|nr:tRNA lysidine(34) synthetase TilS [Arenimonas sp. SCN 70-307]ODS63997.1 MAG: tRNA lysidine(34) synthetase TilS [Arenimonas sp. SCN 70-307]
MALTLPPLPVEGPLLLAYSGGLDSTVLLHALAADPAVRARGLRALHVDHGLHPGSAAWGEACADNGRMLDVPLSIVRVEVRPDGDGPEAAARRARHAAFAQALQPGELLVTAHHRDDQAETVLLRLLRGAGDGLAAMRPLRPFAAGWLWRPLLGLPREALVSYAREHGLHWVEDPSNASDRHDRNFLRHHVLPRLQERWPQADAALARSAALLATQADLLAGEDARRLAQVQGVDPQALSVHLLMAEPPAWRARLLRAWLAGQGLPPLPTDAIGTIERELLAARPDASACFEWSGAVIHRWRDLLHAGPARAPLPADWSAEWTGEAPLALPTGDTLALDPPRRFEAPLRVHARQGGERLVLPGRAHHTELKHALQDLGIPPWERACLPLLSAPDGTLLAAADLLLSAPLADWLARHATRLRWARTVDRAEA